MKFGRFRACVGVLLGGLGLSLASASSALATPPAPGSWRLAFQDEFNDTTVDRAKWATQYARPGDAAFSNPANGEAQWYKARNVTEGGGSLQLTAKRERTVSPYTGAAFNYSSGMVTSKPSLNFRYGYFEARVRYPKGSGFWPAFWTWPSSPSYSTPEIDVTEFFGDNPNFTYLVYHPQAAPNAHETWRRKVLRASDWTARWHRIGVDWQPGRLTWYVDGVRRWSVADTADRRMYLIANLAIARPPVAPAPNGSTPFPSSYKIDYIRVWKRR